jgi:hypothetical protein
METAKATGIAWRSLAWLAGAVATSIAVAVAAVIAVVFAATLVVIGFMATALLGLAAFALRGRSHPAAASGDPGLIEARTWAATRGWPTAGTSGLATSRIS